MDRRQALAGIIGVSTTTLLSSNPDDVDACVERVAPAAAALSSEKNKLLLIFRINAEATSLQLGRLHHRIAEHLERSGIDLPFMVIDKRIEVKAQAPHRWRSYQGDFEEHLETSSEFVMTYFLEKKSEAHGRAGK